MKIRSELREDAAAIRALHIAAFPTSLEAGLVEALRETGAAALSAVAVDHGAIVGHVMLSGVLIDGVSAFGLAPLAVLPQRQRRRIGTALVWHALERARQAGAAAVVLVGEPRYYQRFGFVPARQFALRCKWPGTEEAFMALELHPGSLKHARGLVSYHPAFDAV